MKNTVVNMAAIILALASGTLFGSNGLYSAAEQFGAQAKLIALQFQGKPEYSRLSPRIWSLYKTIDYLKRTVYLNTGHWNARQDFYRVQHQYFLFMQAYRNSYPLRHTRRIMFDVSRLRKNFYRLRLKVWPGRRFSRRNYRRNYRRHSNFDPPYFY